MKQKLVILSSFVFFFLLSSVAFCQDEEVVAKKCSHQIGVNTTFFFKQFLNFSDNNTIAVSPYVLTYKLISAKNHALRIGVGGTYSDKTETDEDSNLPPRKTNAYEFDFSIGYEYRKPLSEKWLCFFGVDAITDQVSSKVVASDVSEEVTTITKTTKFGGAAVVGIQFNISKRVSLFTETSVQFSGSNTSFESKFKNQPFFNEKETIKETNINFVLPTSLFLAINL